MQINKSNKLTKFFSGLLNLRTPKTGSQLPRFLKAFHGILSLMVISGFLALASIYIVGYPGGLSALIGTALADYCTNTGSCDISTLLSATAAALIILTGLLTAVIYSIFFWDNTDDDIADSLELINRKLDWLYKSEK